MEDNNIAKTDRCVVRNAAYRRGEFSVRERHNERKNQSYGNGDIVQERAELNVHFKTCPSTYEQKFNRMVDDGTISLRGLKKDAKVFDELVFDVNSAYFENHGGYEYAKDFFAEAYRLAVDEVGGEEYILSAVMHADERNSALSEQLGHDVFHYHLHVTYIPVVDKEVKWTKRCKDPALVGKVKEVIKQVSHSKKWPRYKTEKGWVNSYSLLQDRFYEHMKDAGFTDFERGERGSTAEHLSVLDYKMQQDKARADALDGLIDRKEKAAANLDLKVEKREERLSDLQNKLTVTKKNAVTFSKLEGMGKKTFLGKVELSPPDWDITSSLAKEGLSSRGIIKKLKDKIKALTQKIADLEAELKQYRSSSITDSMQYYKARQRAPRRLAEVVADIMRKPPEHQEKSRTDRVRNNDMEI